MMQAEPRQESPPVQPWLALRRSPAFPWLLVALLAAGVRLLLLDRAPLAEPEAAYAFPAWQGVLGQLDDTLVDQGAPLFSHLMALTFWFFGASDATARLVPALAGVALALTPALLVPVIGQRAALSAGVLLAVSPIAVELSRQVDPAMLASALAMIAIASVIRLWTDRPAWAPWLLAASVGLGLACHAGFVIGVGAAALAAYATWGRIPRPTRRPAPTPEPTTNAAGRRGTLADAEGEPAFVTWGREQFGAWFGPIALGIGLALVGATALLTDLAGVGFIVGGVWGGALQALAPGGLLSRYLGVFLADALPLAILAAVGFGLAVRGRDRIAAFFAQWAFLLIILSAGFGALGTAGPALYVTPLAILAGIAVDRLAPWHALAEVSGAGLAAASVTLAVLLSVFLLLVAVIGGPRSAPVAAWVVVVGGAALAAWMWAQAIEPHRRAPAVIVIASCLFALLTVGTMLRLSFGGSPEATEPLAPVQTSQQFRDAFVDLKALWRREPQRVLVYDASTPLIARWYGRDLRQVAERSNLPGETIRFRAAPAAQTRMAPGDPWRVPLQTVGQLDPGGLNPAGFVRWAAARTGMVLLRTQDIIILR